MANPFPAAVKARLAASGGGAQVSLLEILTNAGNRYYWSDSDITAVIALPMVTAVMSGFSIRYFFEYSAETFLPWLLSAGPFHTNANTTTSSGSVTVQNLSGDTVRRDVSQIFSKTAMVGALFFYRIWLADCEFATFSMMGTIDDADVDADGDSMTLSLESLCNWSKIDAPNQDIGPSCQLAFASTQCGSTSSTPCQNSYGSCTSIERFMGVILEWNGATLDPSQTITPAPLRLQNTRVAS